MELRLPLLLYIVGNILQMNLAEVSARGSWRGAQMRSCLTYKLVQRLIYTGQSRLGNCFTNRRHGVREFEFRLYEILYRQQIKVTIYKIQWSAFRYNSMSDSDAEERPPGTASRFSERKSRLKDYYHGRRRKGVQLRFKFQLPNGERRSWYFNIDSNGAAQRHPTCAICKDYQNNQQT